MRNVCGRWVQDGFTYTSRQELWIIFHIRLQDFDVFAAQQPDTAASATPEPTSQTGLAAAAALVHGAPSPIPTTPTPPAGNAGAGADLAQPDTVAAQTVALIHAEQTQQQPQTQLATIGQEKSTQEKVSGCWRPWPLTGTTLVTDWAL